MTKKIPVSLQDVLERQRAAAASRRSRWESVAHQHRPSDYGRLNNIVKIDPSQRPYSVAGRPRVANQASLISSTSLLDASRGLPSHPVIAVSLPVWNTPPHLFERALRSILNQTYDNLVVLVSSDGESLPTYEGCSLLSDPRVVVHRTKRNWGPYFHHHLTWLAAGADLFAVQDSDDFSDPDRLKTQLEALRRFRGDAAFASVTEHRRGRTVRVDPFPASSLGPNLRHPLDHFWLVRSDFLDALGGYYFGTRVGADSLLTTLALQFGRNVAVPEARYHRYEREGSLTQHRSTGYQSNLRANARATLEELWARARVTRDSRALREILVSARSAEEENDLQRKAEELRPAFAQARSAAAQPGGRSRPTPKLLVGDSDLERVLDHARFSDWSITRKCAVELFGEITRLKSRSIIDFGSGVSTLVFALHAKRTGAKVVSVEADPRWYQITAESLADAGLSEYVDLIEAPLVYATRHRISRRTYKFDFDRGAPYDFVFIDGPPEIVGRHGTLPSVAQHMASEWHGWLHDGARSGERRCVALWSKYLPLQFSSSLSFSEDARGVLKMSSR